MSSWRLGGQLSIMLVATHTDPEEGIGQTECPGKTASGPRSPATIGKRQRKNSNLSFGPF